MLQGILAHSALLLCFALAMDYSVKCSGPGAVVAWACVLLAMDSAKDTETCIAGLNDPYTLPVLLALLS